MTGLLKGAIFLMSSKDFFTKPYLGAYLAGQLGWSYSEKTQEQTV